MIKELCHINTYSFLRLPYTVFSLGQHSTKVTGSFLWRRKSQWSWWSDNDDDSVHMKMHNEKCKRLSGSISRHSAVVLLFIPPLHGAAKWHTGHNAVFYIITVHCTQDQCIMFCSVLCCTVCCSVVGRVIRLPRSVTTNSLPQTTLLPTKS